MNNLLVVGTVNMDYTFYVDAHPLNDFAYIPNSIHRAPGGHGGNCATAIARAGGQVSLLTRIGKDSVGGELLADLAAEGISADYVIQTVERSGQVYIPVFSDNYKYMIMDIQVLNPLSAQDVDVDRLAGAFSFVVIFDEARELSLAVLRAFRARGKKICAVMCAASKLEHTDFAACGYPDYIIANREEAKAIPLDSLRGRSHMVVTLGEEGAVCYLADGRVIKVVGVPAAVRDAIGAGDCFTGIFCHLLSTGSSIEDALTVANRGAAFSTQKSGARAGMPYRKDIDAFMVTATAT